MCWNQSFILYTVHISFIFYKVPPCGKISLKKNFFFFLILTPPSLGVLFSEWKYMLFLAFWKWNMLKGETWNEEFKRKRNLSLKEMCAFYRVSMLKQLERILLKANISQLFFLWTQEEVRSQHLSINQKHLEIHCSTAVTSRLFNRRFSIYKQIHTQTRTHTHISHI